MLIRFSVENFLSFKDQTNFYMSAGKFVRHSDHVATEKGKRLLKGGFLFGANASGKSNFISAVAFARNVVKDGLNHINYEKMYFRIEKEYRKKPGIFQFDCISNGHFYAYGFAISYLSGMIEEEWLYQTDEQETCIFLRHRSIDGKSFVVDSDITFSDEKQRQRFEVYSEDICNPKMAQTLFLTDIFHRSPGDETIYTPFSDVYEWFMRLIIIFPNTKYSGIMRLLDDDNKRTNLSNLLRYFDTGIENVIKRRTEIDQVFSELVNIENLKAELAKGLNNVGDKALFGTSEMLIEVGNEAGTLVANEIMCSHGNDADLFDFRDESDGTRRLFDLLPIFQCALKERIIFVDELDRSLHSRATQEFIRYFYDVTTDISTQLIVTTQDSNLMDLDFLRQDEIWFVEREKDHGSKLYSLNQYKVRFDKKVEKDYLLGRYGAVPVFRQFSMIEEIENESGAEGGNS